MSSQQKPLLLDCGGKSLDLSIPNIMGVLNVTPDSFSDGGKYIKNLDAALRHAQQMVAEGATIIDVGGESTRPGAAVVSVQQELDRVIPVIETLHAELPVVLSADTSTPEVMEESARAGVGLINDVRALSRDGALQKVAALGLPVCLMHMQGSPETMQNAPTYDDVVSEVIAYLQQRVTACVSAGIASNHVILDPGFGFGKSLRHNLQLLNRLNEVVALGFPVLAGLSRKSMLGTITGKPVEQRVNASVAAAALAVAKGAKIIRCHDVAETVDAIKITTAVINEST